MRGHWHIENKVHYVRDVTWDEDRSQVRTANGPRAMTTLRNVAIGLVRLGGWSNIASALRYYAVNRAAALTLIGV